MTYLPLLVRPALIPPHALHNSPDSFFYTMMAIPIIGTLAVTYMLIQSYREAAEQDRKWEEWKKKHGRL